MITLYTKPNCPYCTKAKQWLRENGFDFEVIDITLNPYDREFILDRGHKTVPQIYWNDNILLVSGGYEGLSVMTREQLQETIDFITNIENDKIENKGNITIGTLRERDGLV